MATEPRSPDLRAPWTRALVIGLGASGAGAAALLLAAGVETRGYDQRHEVAGLAPGLTTFLGEAGPPDTAFEGIDLLVLSPGIPPASYRARLAVLCPHANIHGEMSLALALTAPWPTVPTVLITGTNGKSTVTAMTGAMLEQGGLTPFIGGNLGPPVSQMVLDVHAGRRERPGSLVLECSSYQLETLLGHPTRVAMLLNVAEDHLGRYASMQHYADTKARVFSGLRADGLALLDANDPFTPRLAPEVGPRVVLVDGTLPPRVDDARLMLSDAESLDRSLLHVAGRHNAKNALFAALGARHLGVALEDCARALTGFVGLPHRMQLVAEVEGIAFYDDSKATNVSAAMASLDGFERPFVLIAGGQAKGDDLTPLGTLLQGRARGLVTLGEARDQFAALAGNRIPVASVADMHEAVAAALLMAKRGDAIVLSPACASWDMYDDFAHRGRVFAQAVAALPRDRA